MQRGAAGSVRNRWLARTAGASAGGSGQALVTAGRPPRQTDRPFLPVQPTRHDQAATSHWINPPRPFAPGGKAKSSGAGRCTAIMCDEADILHRWHQNSSSCLGTSARSTRAGRRGSRSAALGAPVERADEGGAPWRSKPSAAATSSRPQRSGAAAPARIRPHRRRPPVPARAEQLFFRGAVLHPQESFSRNFQRPSQFSDRYQAAGLPSAPGRHQPLPVGGKAIRSAISSSPTDKAGVRAAAAGRFNGSHGAGNGDRREGAVIDRSRNPNGARRAGLRLCR